MVSKAEPRGLDWKDSQAWILDDEQIERSKLQLEGDVVSKAEPRGLDWKDSRAWTL